MLRPLGTLVAALFCLFTTTSFAAPTPHYGASFTYPLIAKDPGHLTGARMALWYQPSSLIWDKVHVYFDASFAHWHVTSSQYNHRDINITAVAPILRFYFNQTPIFSPYGEITIGAAYLSSTHFADRNLGMHFAFQDGLALGAVVGRSQRLAISFSGMHYSNGSLCSMNAGITIPLLINVSYGFA